MSKLTKEEKMAKAIERQAAQTHHVKEPLDETVLAGTPSETDEEAGEELSDLPEGPLDTAPKAISDLPAKASVEDRVWHICDKLQSYHDQLTGVGNNTQALAVIAPMMDDIRELRRLSGLIFEN